MKQKRNKRINYSTSTLIFISWQRQSIYTILSVLVGLLVALIPLHSLTAILQHGFVRLVYFFICHMYSLSPIKLYLNKIGYNSVQS